MFFGFLVYKKYLLDFILPFEFYSSSVDSAIIKFILYCTRCSIGSRHGKVEASFTLLIWLNENVLLLLCLKSSSV